ncbi:hypothetical protein VTJ49DRAFT_5196 [Mycothermus thermophilus]|uniref:PNPLA domain-containing protein n=1 Tax=Humicola insolens TaxID=85995 RepID=A0ABR3VKN9_HUMIN
MAPHSDGVRILSLDGGGIRGLSSLLILEHLMERLCEAQGLKEVPRPCDCFDMIGGTSTGGIIAIMLGRLRMTVDECIRAYRKMAEQAFTPKRTTWLPASPSGAFSATAFEAAIRDTVKEFCPEAECAARRASGHSTTSTCMHGEAEFRDPSCTSTVVLAITKDNVDARPTLFTTYNTSMALSGCTIWQVARATSAATTFFKPIHIGRDDVEFIDAAFGYNNPCEVLIEEARQRFPGRPLGQVVSIGTGLGDVVSIDDTRFSIIKALKEMATTSKAVAGRLDDRFGGDGRYVRFNVERGLEDTTLSDWNKASSISAHTRNYLSDNRRAVDQFVATFLGRDQQRDEIESEAVPRPLLLNRPCIRKNQDAAKLLGFIARVESKAIPRSMLPSAGSEQRMTRAIGVLCGYSFLSRREDGTTYDMHRLVHLALRVWVNKQDAAAEQRREDLVEAERQ